MEPHTSGALQAFQSEYLTFALTDLATRALVIQGAEGDGGEEDGDVEEDGRGHVLQQGFITADDT